MILFKIYLIIAILISVTLLIIWLTGKPTKLHYDLALLWDIPLVGIVVIIIWPIVLFWTIIDEFCELIKRLFK